MTREKPFQRELAALVRQMDLTQSELARRADLSQSYVSGMVKSGSAPTRNVVLQIADGLELDFEMRGRLLRAAGYADEAGDTPEGGQPLPRPVVTLAQEAVGLSPTRLEVVRWLLQDPQRIDGIALLRDSRVMHALAAA